jgi:hypothetical protein
MHSAHARPGRWTGVTAVLVGLVLIPAVVLGAAPGGEKPKADAKRAAKQMVDAIVNRNKAPKVVKWPKWPGGFTRQAALFREDYDWNEDARAREAISRLEEDRTEEVWEEMVRRTGDRRYAETVTSAKTGDAYVRTVGGICDEIAYSRLIGVFWKHLPEVEGKDGDEKLGLDIGIRDLAKWRKERAAKPLYELQIEVCEKTIKALAKVKRVPRAERARARKKIEAEIAKLKRTRRPSHVPGGPPNYEERGVYNAELARRVREGVKSGKYGDLGIIK